MSDDNNILSKGFLGLQPPISLADAARALWEEPYRLARFTQPPTKAAGAGAGFPFGLPLPGSDLTNSLIAAALEKYRRRESWNDRFEHWEKPASSTEESTLVRAQRAVKTAIRDAVWLNTMGARVEPQGSNTRLDSDADLRVQLPLYKTDYHPNVVISSANSVLAISGSSWTLEQLFAMMRWELEVCLTEAFGKENVTPGNKAFKVKGVTGSRAEVDVVPAVGYQNIMWWDHAARYNVLEGVALLSTDGRWTINFPERHRREGIAKRNRTGHQYKKLVRILKRLRADLTRRGLLHTKAPSFLVESLVYNVEDGYFTVAGDDRYDRVRRVARRLQAMVHDEPTAARMTEANGIKRLFSADQAWTWAQAKMFADAVVAHLGDA